MSAIHVYMLRCDDTHPVLSGGRKRCDGTFETQSEKASECRKLAAATGWTCERAPSGNGFFHVHDFCPSCSRRRAAHRTQEVTEIASEGG